MKFVLLRLFMLNATLAIASLAGAGTVLASVGAGYFQQELTVSTYTTWPELVRELDYELAQASGNPGSHQNGMIRGCTGHVIELSSPQLTKEELQALTSCSSETIPQLIAALESQDWKIKVVSAHALGLSGIRAYSAIPALSNLMQSENADVRFAVAQALGQIGTEAVVPALTEALQDPDENVRVSAVIAFQNIGLAANQAKAELIAALWDGNWFVKTEAAKTISKLGLNTSDIPTIVNPLKDNIEPHDGAIVALMLSIYPSVFNKLEDLPLFFIEGLESEDPEVRETAAIALGLINLTRIGDDRLHESASALQRVAKDQDSKVRASALRALYQTRPSYYDDIDSQSIQLIDAIDFYLLEGLSDPDPNVRQVTLETFEYYGRQRISTTRYLAVILAALEAIEDEDSAIRQSAFNVLYTNLDTLDSLPSIKPQIPDRVVLALTNSLYDKDANVRQNAGSTLAFGLYYPIDAVISEPFMAALIDILQQENIDSNIRYDAFYTIATEGKNIIGRSQVIAELLEDALEDSDIGIRVNAASALVSAGSMSPQDSVPIFIGGLKSESPLAKLHAIFALDRMCNVHKPNCIEALPFLVDALRVDINPLEYAAALAIVNIDPNEESAIAILEEILLEESDYVLRATAIYALTFQISSPDSLLAATHVELEDNQTRYARSCRIHPRIPINGDRGNRFKSTEPVLEALRNPDLRTSASHTFNPLVSGLGPGVDTLLSPTETQFLVSELTSILGNGNSAYAKHPLLESIFKLKGQDLRRSVIYSLGTIGSVLLGESVPTTYFYDSWSFGGSGYFDLYPEIQSGIIETLTDVVTDQEDNLEVRWMAAALLQAANVPIDNFFLRENLVDPAVALAQSRWVGVMEPPVKDNYFTDGNYPAGWPEPIDSAVMRRQQDFLLNQYGYIPGGYNTGLEFDIYSKQYLYNTRTQCGDGLGEIFSKLQRLFNRTSE